MPPRPLQYVLDATPRTRRLVVLQVDVFGARGPMPRTLSEVLERQREPVDIVHLIYRNKPYELDSKDYEFSRAMVREHWEAGMRDMRATVAHPEWLKRATENGITTYDLAEPQVARVRHPVALKAQTQ